MDNAMQTSLRLRDHIEKYISEKYGAKPEHLWEKYPEYEVFRHNSEETHKGKWFLLIANVTYKQIGKMSESEDEDLLVAVVKENPEAIESQLSKPGFAPAYHMNKHAWISLMLDGSQPVQVVEEYIDKSYSLT